MKWQLSKTQGLAMIATLALGMILLSGMAVRSTTPRPSYRPAMTLLRRSCRCSKTIGQNLSESRRCSCTGMITSGKSRIREHHT